MNESHTHSRSEMRHSWLVSPHPFSQALMLDVLLARDKEPGSEIDRGEYVPLNFPSSANTNT